MDMIEMWLAMISTNTISVGVDLVLILVLMAMWLLWWKQSQRTQRIESGLLEAASQLQEATALLDDALNQISLLQRQEQVKPEKVQKDVAASPSVSMDTQDDNFDDDIEPQFSSRARELLNAQKNHLEMTSKVAPKRVSSAQKAEPQNKQGVMDVAQILRMQREGASLDSIADTLNMPLAQVKLMLMLQKGV